MTVAEEHFRRRQLDLEKLTGERIDGVRAPPPTAVQGEIGSDERRRNLQLISDNQKLMQMVEQVQSDLEKRVAINNELNEQIISLKEQLVKMAEAQRDRTIREDKLSEEFKISEFRLKKTRDEVVELKGRIKDLTNGGKGEVGGMFEIKRENARLKKLIGEKIFPLLQKKDELISMYERVSRLRHGSEELVSEVDKLNN
jgi:hypothetical protein